MDHGRHKITSQRLRLLDKADQPFCGKMWIQDEGLPKIERLHQRVQTQRIVHRAKNRGALIAGLAYQRIRPFKTLDP